jgi:hypothetical protein
MAKMPALVVAVKVDETVNELFDISNDLDELVCLSPSWQQQEAGVVRDRIVNKLLDWVDASEEKQK